MLLLSPPSFLRVSASLALSVPRVLCPPLWCVCVALHPSPCRVNQSPVDRLRLHLAGEELPLTLE